MPQTTLQSNSWASRNFNAWKEWRNQQDLENQVPANLLVSGTAAELNKWLSLYVAETRKKDGTHFPSSSLTLLLSGLKRWMTQQNPYAVDILSETDPEFSGLRSVRDRMARKLRKDGVGAVVKHAEIITVEDEVKLWEAGVMGVTSARALLNAVFFMNGKVLCLRGGREHHCLKVSQFSFGKEVQPDGSSMEYVEYVENGSKNRSGSYKDKCENKVIKQYAEPKLKERCYVFILKLYISKLAEEAVREDKFYCRAKESTPTDNFSWYIQMPVGRNILQTMVKTMCKEVGVIGKSNHSLRATGTARLYAANVPEKIIQQRSGHRCIDSLRLYERTSVTQQRAVSSLISGAEVSSFDEQLKENDPKNANTGTEQSSAGKPPRSTNSKTEKSCLDYAALGAAFTNC